MVNYKLTWVPSPTVVSASVSSSSTAGGTTIGITGSNFNESLRPIVVFGSTTSSTTFVSTTQLQAVTPAHASGSVVISVNQAGYIAELNGTFEFSGSASPTGSEPSYNPVTDALLIYDDFSSYTNVSALIARYPTGRSLELLTLADNVVTLHYATGEEDILLGPEGKLGSIGAWNGTLPEIAGPYSHCYFSTVFKTNIGGDFTEGMAGIKGFMFWHSAGRYEFGVSRIRGLYLSYPEGRGPCQNYENAYTGLNIFRTPDGAAPKWSDFNDGNWHRYTVEIFSKDSGHVGFRIWLDGVLTEDCVDNLFEGGYSTYEWPVRHFDVFGNSWIWTGGSHVDISFNEWTFWTDGS